MQITFQCKISCSVLFSVTYHHLLLFILHHVALILDSLFTIIHSTDRKLHYHTRRSNVLCKNHASTCKKLHYIFSNIALYSSHWKRAIALRLLYTWLCKTILNNYRCATKKITKHVSSYKKFSLHYCWKSFESALPRRVGPTEWWYLCK